MQIDEHFHMYANFVEIVAIFFLTYRYLPNYKLLLFTSDIVKLYLYVYKRALERILTGIQLYLQI